MFHGFIKVAAASPNVVVGNVELNTEQIRQEIVCANNAGVHVLVLPGLSLTGCTCGDLYYSQALLSSAQAAIIDIANFTSWRFPVVVLGAPILRSGRLYNCAVVIHDGKILGIVPQVHTDREKPFASAASLMPGLSVSLGGNSVPFGTDLLFACKEMPDFCLGVELGADMLPSNAPSVQLCREGAAIIANPADFPQLAGSSQNRRLQLKSISDRLCCAYIHANPSSGESTQDLVYSGHQLIVENGDVLAENPAFSGVQRIISEVDVGLLSARRLRSVPSQAPTVGYRTIEFSQELGNTTLTRSINAAPFLPKNTSDVDEFIEEILQIQSHGLKKRLAHTGLSTAVIGISGGLDSCLALLVAARAFDLLGFRRERIIALSMPCFGTTSRTRSNAEQLCKSLGVTFREISIADSVRRHFQDMLYDENLRDVTYENSQARERTQLLMDYANMVSGIVIGTGDLSELALGWATFNGDHMSMYGVNAGVPKTLIRRIVGAVAAQSPEPLAKILLDILDTPISPELLPADSEDGIQQKTEDLVGPYALHDFFLYHTVFNGFSPSKIDRLARLAFEGIHTPDEIRFWLKTFFRRFFQQQFKRSCLPDGPSVGPVSLSPRIAWHMPSDASYALWMKEIDAL